MSLRKASLCVSICSILMQFAASTCAVHGIVQHQFARFGIIFDSALRQKSEHCRMPAICRTKNYHLHSRHAGAKFSTLHGFCHILSVLLVNLLHHFDMASENWILFCGWRSKLQVECYLQHVEVIICTLPILHIVAWCLQRVAAKIWTVNWAVLTTL